MQFFTKVAVVLPLLAACLLPQTMAVTYPTASIVFYFAPTCLESSVAPVGGEITITANKCYNFGGKTPVESFRGFLGSTPAKGVTCTAKTFKLIDCDEGIKNEVLSTTSANTCVNTLIVGTQLGARSVKVVCAKA